MIGRAEVLRVRREYGPGIASLPAAQRRRAIEIFQKAKRIDPRLSAELTGVAVAHRLKKEGHTRASRMQTEICLAMSRRACGENFDAEGAMVGAMAATLFNGRDHAARRNLVAEGASRMSPYMWLSRNGRPEQEAFISQATARVIGKESVYGTVDGLPRPDAARFMEAVLDRTRPIKEAA